MALATRPAGLVPCAFRRPSARRRRQLPSFLLLLISTHLLSVAGDAGAQPAFFRREDLLRLRLSLGRISDEMHAMLGVLDGALDASEEAARQAAQAPLPHHHAPPPPPPLPPYAAQLPPHADEWWEKRRDRAAPSAAQQQALAPGASVSDSAAAAVEWLTGGWLQGARRAGESPAAVVPDVRPSAEASVQVAAPAVSPDVDGASATEAGWQDLEAAAAVAAAEAGWRELESAAREAEAATTAAPEPPRVRVLGADRDDDDRADSAGGSGRDFDGSAPRRRDGSQDEERLSDEEAPIDVDWPLTSQAPPRDDADQRPPPGDGGSILWAFCSLCFRFFVFLVDVAIIAGMQTFLEAAGKPKKKQHGRRKLESSGFMAVISQEELAAAWLSEHWPKMAFGAGLSFAGRLPQLLLGDNSLVTQMVMVLTVMLRCMSLVMFFIRDDMFSASGSPSGGGLMDGMADGGTGAVRDD
eukprot:TRINITY_DN28986_c0_g1_i1.p1 TRINITY_DN28986_c0_g1~~TRINITY_DN28986_c0_g1_i1.p1  ORF type:complete len:469 (+),score=140.23 TRINITY_DN28986_c0_g1_i1:82-1488(+)